MNFTWWIPTLVGSSHTFFASIASIRIHSHPNLEESIVQATDNKALGPSQLINTLHKNPKTLWKKWINNKYHSLGSGLRTGADQNIFGIFERSLALYQGLIHMMISISVFVNSYIRNSFPDSSCSELHWVAFLRDSRTLIKQQSPFPSQGGWERLKWYCRTAQDHFSSQSPPDSDTNHTLPI